ncbi:ATP-binding cassette domain-containing protein [Demetria terragena]|uniref:ATP-binding cassette domain-containing protein n=1 Tax=Demetria terragena TaxID=63959 RepID=UPI00037070B0|nr:ATP-binding cassette domain-containing protein [Demetria terragena]
MTTPIISLVQAGRTFGGVTALAEIDIDLYPGEVHCLLGDNGAGKSTLIKLLSGVHALSSGAMHLDGESVRLASPREAQSRGIATVHQDTGAIPLMSVAKNFFLGVEPTRGRGLFSRFDTKKANTIALEQIRAMGITRVTDADQLVGTLSGGERQALAIARASYFGAKVLILDEPTSALGVKEATVVLRQIEKAREDGIAVVFITHNATHAIAVGDRFSVLIQGRVAAQFLRGQMTRNQILDLMAGGEESLDLFDRMES